MLIAEERRSSSRYVIEPATLADDAGWRSLFFLTLLTFCFVVEWAGFWRSWYRALT